MLIFSTHLLLYCLCNIEIIELKFEIVNFDFVFLCNEYLKDEIHRHDDFNWKSHVKI